MEPREKSANDATVTDLMRATSRRLGETRFVRSQNASRLRPAVKDRLPAKRNKPLIVSEYGILAGLNSGYDQERVKRTMIATFDHFSNARSSTPGYPADGNKLVQAWNWFSLDWEDLWGHQSYGHLFDPDTKLITPLGLAYGNYVTSH